jgi:hypothetical protein
MVDLEGNSTACGVGWSAVPGAPGFNFAAPFGMEIAKTRSGGERR